ncbi:MAG: hypothetical protein IJK97_07645 [Thermoguttaceae bacterium]|nr:hypothetical protein [Thermoguttaceae bacterium]
MNRIFALFALVLAVTTAGVCEIFAQENSAERPDLVIADFETDDFDGWKIDGSAFQLRDAGAPYRGGMGPVSGFHGHNRVNTYAAVGDDKATGTLTSPEFRIERKFISFLIGGGNFPGQTGIALLVDGEKVTEQTGLYNVPQQGDEGLKLRFWDVSRFQGKTARIVIFDRKPGGNWAHIKADFICQTDVQPDPAANVISVAQDARATAYDRMIFGHFIEHFHRQVYGGIFEPGSPLSDENGFRRDVIEALREIQVPIVRWPGGCFVSAYHWKKGVGPDRQPAWDKAWHVEEPNTFGTAEYVQWCRLIGAEPYICTNAGTGTPEEMSDWVEYCNLNVGEFGRMRQAHGFKEPFNVKYWSVGNENWGRHEMGAKTVGEWGDFVRESGKLMLNTDPDIKLFAAALPNENWTLPLLEKAGYLLDYVSIHGYWDGLSYNNNPSPYMECMMRTQRPEASILSTIGVLEKTKMRGKVFIAFDEWNLRGWHHPGIGMIPPRMDVQARDKNDINSTYTMADALFSACFLNSCLRHCDDVKIACFSPIVNTRGALYVYPQGLVKRTTYHVFWMYVHLLEKNILPVELNCEPLLWNQKQTPKLDAVLSVNDDQTRYVLAVVNKDPETAAEVKLNFLAGGRNVPETLEATVLCGASPDDFNDVGAENRVVPQKTALKVQNGKVTLAPHSLTVIAIPGK